MVHLQTADAGPHTGAEVKSWFALHPDIPCLQWPPHSPDLNMIELVWARMKSVLNRSNPSLPMTRAIQIALDMVTMKGDMQGLKEKVISNWVACIHSDGGNRHRTQ